MIGGILVISNPQLQYKIPAFPDVALLFRFTGIRVPDLFSDIDVFVVWYIVVLTHLFHSVMKIRLYFSVICSMVNWSLIMMTQKVLLSLANPSNYRITQ